MGHRGYTNSFILVVTIIIKNFYGEVLAAVEIPIWLEPPTAIRSDYHCIVVRISIFNLRNTPIVRTYISKGVIAY